MKIYISQLYN